MSDTRRRARARTERRRAASERIQRPLLTPAEKATAHAIAAHILDLHDAGDHWEHMLVTVDERWPGAKYRTVLTALFLGQLAWERRKQKRALQ